MKQLKQRINTSQLSKVFFLILVLLAVTAIASYAKAPTSFEDPDTPIDRSISIQLAAGVDIGIKKVKEMRKRKKLI